MAIYNKLYRHNLALLTDLYQLTMAYGYQKQDMHQREAVFNLFFRKNPFNGQFAVACGLEMAIEVMRNFHFTADDVQYLGSLKGADKLPLFDETFLNYLQRLKFSCSVDAVPEGTVVFPHQPLLRVRGPLLQAQILETILLNIINFSTLIATKAARIAQITQGDTILEFGLRRAQGIDGGLTASRASFVGGCHATSNVLAGKLLGIPVRGTHAHSWVMCFENEFQAFQAYAKAMPNNCFFLIDTYDTLEGVRNAIRVGNWLKNNGHKLLGVRLDSGDMAALSQKARQMLNDAGFEDALIVASNNLNEKNILDLKKQGASINIWGIGTELVTAYDQPALGGVYKLGAIRNKNGEWHYPMKISEDPVKISNPGILQVKRFYDANNLPVGDLLYNESIENPTQGTHQAILYDQKDFSLKTCAFDHAENLLQPIFKEGKLVYSLPTLRDIRARTLAQLELFEKIGWEHHLLGFSERLHEQKMGVAKMSAL